MNPEEFAEDWDVPSTLLGFVVGVVGAACGVVAYLWLAGCLC